MVLAGSVNKDIVALLNCAGIQSVGLCGKDGNLLCAQKMVPEDGSDIGHVGRIEQVNTKVLRALCENDMVPVIAPIATDEHGGVWNINADTAAGKLRLRFRQKNWSFLRIPLVCYGM